MKLGTSVLQLQVNASTAKACPLQLVGPTEPHRNFPLSCDWLYNSICSALSFFHYLLHSNGNREVILLHPVLKKKNNAFILFSTSFAHSNSRYHNFLLLYRLGRFKSFTCFVVYFLCCCHKKFYCLFGEFLCLAGLHSSEKENLN